MLRALVSALLIGAAWFLQSPPSSPAQDKKGPELKPGEEPLPANAFKRFGTSKFRHGSRILCLSYSPDGRILAAGGGDDPVRLWDRDTGNLLRTLPEAWVNSIVFSPGGSVVITGGAFKTIRLWEAASGKERSKLEGHKSPVKAMAMSPNGTYLASGDADGNIILWEPGYGAVVTTFKGHTDEITALAFSPDSKTLASVSGDRTIRLWDVKNSKFLKQVDGGCMISSLAFIDRKVFASGGDDNLIRIWNVEEGKQTDTWKGHDGNVVSLQVIRSEEEDGKAPRPLTLVSGAHDGSIRLWDLVKKGEPRVIVRSVGDSDALALTSGADLIATAGINNTIRIFETASLKEQTFGPGHVAGVHALALSPDGKKLVSASTMGDILVWEAISGKLFGALKNPKGGEMVLAFAPDSETLASAVGGDAIRIWNATEGKESFNLPAAPGDPTLSLAFTRTGQTLIVGHRSGKVVLWDLKDRKPGREFKYAGPAYTLDTSVDGKTLAVSGGNKVTLWNLDDGKEIKTFGTRDEGPDSTWPVVSNLAFHPDGNLIALSCYDGVIRLMDTSTGKEVRSCDGHTSVAYGMRFSSDGRIIATASFDRTVRLWESFSGQQVGLFKGHHGPGTAVAFSKDGRSFFSASADTTILHWDATGAGPTVPVFKLTVPEMQDMYLNLASEETARAHGVLWKFVGGGKDSVNYIESNLYLVDPKHIDQLFEDLKSETYKVREKATAELEKYGRWMQGRLEEAAKNKDNTLEVSRRIERLLTKLSTAGSLSLPQERLRIRRAMLIMEQVADENSVRVLDKLSKGAPEPALQAEAAASVVRLRARGVK